MTKVQRVCNAHKHPPGCQCGFGPPYDAPYVSENVTEWAREVVDRPDLITRGLRESAWDEPSIDEFIRAYQELRNEQLPPHTLVTRIKQLLGMRRRTVEEVSEDWINVPLYRFGAPNVADAKVQYSEGEGIVRGSGWSLKIFGIGTGNTTTVQVNKSRTFVADAGTWKQVYVPVKLLVYHIAVYERTRLVGRGINAEVAPPPVGAARDHFLKRRGVKTIPRTALGDRPEEYDDIVECSFHDDTSGAVHRDRRSWETDVAEEVAVKLAKVADVSALVNVKRTRRLELEFSLPAGHDYLAYLGHGLLWWEHPL